jgi:hypothetical protein
VIRDSPRDFGPNGLTGFEGALLRQCLVRSLNCNSKAAKTAANPSLQQLLECKSWLTGHTSDVFHPNSEGGATFGSLMAPYVGQGMLREA